MNESTTHYNERPDTLVILEEIADIREGPYAEPFWSLLEDRVWTAGYLVRRNRLPTRECGLPMPCGNIRLLWSLLRAIRKHGFSPNVGDEILVRYPSGIVHNGSNRASVLKALGMPVPALLVDNWQNNIIRGKVRWQSQDS